MKKLLELITEEFEKAFEKNEYDKKLGKVVVSNRPDLCQYQCNDSTTWLAIIIGALW